MKSNYFRPVHNYCDIEICRFDPQTTRKSDEKETLQDWGRPSLPFHRFSALLDMLLRGEAWKRQVNAIPSQYKVVCCCNFCLPPHLHLGPVSFYEIRSVSGNVSPKSPLCTEESHLASNPDDNSRPNHAKTKAPKNWDKRDKKLRTFSLTSPLFSNPCESVG